MPNENIALRKAVIELMKLAFNADSGAMGCEPIKIRIKFSPIPNEDGVDVSVRTRLCCDCPQGHRCRGCKLSNGRWGNMRTLDATYYLASPVTVSASPMKADGGTKKRRVPKKPKAGTRAKVKARR